MRKIAILLTLLMLTTTLFACTGAERGTLIESETEEPQSEEVSSEILSSEESSQEELSSEASSEAVSSEEEDKPRLNEDLLSDIGLTYPELVEKRGKLVEVRKVGYGEIGYFFENGYGGYVWHDLDISEEGRETMKKDNTFSLDKPPMPKESTKCVAIENVKTKKLILEMKFPASIDKLEKISGVSDVSNTLLDHYKDEGTYSYYMSFKYDNFIIGWRTLEKHGISGNIYIYNNFLYIRVDYPI